MTIFTILNSYVNYFSIELRKIIKFNYLTILKLFCKKLVCIIYTMFYFVIVTY